MDGNQMATLYINDTVNGKSRKLEPLDCPAEAPLHSMKGRTFLLIPSGKDVFCTEEWNATGFDSLFQPVQHDVFVNLTKYDQISVTQGSFLTGIFQPSSLVAGHVLHLWRFNELNGKQYIAQSFLFTNSKDFNIVQSFIQGM